ncbi:hypothetical protein SLI_6409 [Streptomyces lividans 1326]|uniref:Uncharacterized protein n=1 Tax=Streptomyces lividans 1326 TaxID=1200984 RepID=A0A7U9HFV0_STRLI|nr:hypothetical protein SLI_6409 [Streptomyces lividans 1326]
MRGEVRNGRHATEPHRTTHAAAQPPSLSSLGTRRSEYQ